MLIAILKAHYVRIALLVLLVAVAILSFVLTRPPKTEDSQLTTQSPQVDLKNSGEQDATGTLSPSGDLEALGETFSLDAIGRPDYDDFIKQFSFAAITADNLMDAIKQFDSTGSALASVEQREALFSTLEKSIWSLKLGSSDLIWESRIPVDNFRVNDVLVIGMKEILKWDTDVPEDEIPDTPEALLRLIADRRYFGENGSGYKDLYNELSTEGSSITYRQESAMPATLSEELQNQSLTDTKQGMVSPFPSVIFDSSPVLELEQHGQLLFADIRVAASDKDGDKYSRLKRYYWSQNEELWLPMEFVSLMIDKIPVIVEFF